MTNKRRILVATPLKGDLPKAYFHAALSLDRGKPKDIALDFMHMDGMVVHQARNEIVGALLEGKYDELIFWDKDLLLDNAGENLTAAAILRLINHDEDIVTSPYSSRTLYTHWHVQYLPDQEPDSRDLVKVQRSAIGFSKIKANVFKAIAEKTPDRAYVAINSDLTPHALHEFFPMAPKGKNTPESRLETIKAILAEPATSFEVKLRQIEREATLRYDEPNIYTGEDFYFCDIARSCGFDIHLDTKLIMGHSGEVVLPIPTGRLFEMMGEPWRKEEIVAIKQAIAAKNGGAK